MSVPFLTALDLNKNELLNARIQNLSADPASPGDGQVYYNTTDQTVRQWSATASAWRVRPWVGATSPTAETVGATAATGSSNEGARIDHRHAMPGQVTSSVDGFMIAADKAKLDAATALATVSVLMMRDSAGRAQVVDPSAAQDIATKNYVDSVAQGLDAKPSVRGATVSALAITARTAQTLTLGGTSFVHDGLTYANGERIMVKDSTTGTGAGTWDNGLYSVGGVGTSIVLTRVTDADAWAELVGAFAFVEEGTTNADTGWVCSSNSGGTMGTTAVTWVQFSSAGTVTASNGILKTGSNLTAVVVASGGLTVGASGLALDTTIAARRAAGNVGDGAATQIDVTHSLNTRDIVVNVARATTPWESVMCDVERLDVNTVRLRFAVAPTLNQYRVTVTG